MQAILEKLGIEAVNDGTWFGGESVSDDSASLIESTNPATDEVIARVRATTMAQYEDVIAKAHAQAQRRAWQSRGIGERQDQG
jgi:aldehyde dehydrogenase (NAD+)